ncbi:TPA: thermonuclease family protein [Enterobacter hormaechei subsp. steigerwaltii]|nr:thermonuclease family protein [Enterobacter hormaechei subsp. steigerwaltii]
MFKPIIILAAIVASFTTNAAELHGKVTRVLDGDTLEVLQDGAPVRVRLLNIDAPEKRQDYGRSAADELKTLIHNAPVSVFYDKTDRYGRTLGIVTNSTGQQVNREMVRAGAAWVYTRYNEDDTLAAIEKDAREHKRGLWQQANAVAPWEFRHHKKGA